MSRVKVKFTVNCCHGDKDRELRLPGRYEVCDRCGGTGSHVNPNVDGHGISPEDFAEDPDFREAYFSGVYDVTCQECRGERVIAHVDTEALPKSLRKRIEEQLERAADWAREVAYERRMRESGIEY